MSGRKITVKKIVSQRYPVGILRPSSWDDRIEGVDTIESTDGEKINLQSTGQQSVPQPGWVILVDESGQTSAKSWTLFGLPKGSQIAA
jgi:hypothetical protein